MTTIDEQLMRLAIQESLHARKNGDWPFGAVIARNGQVVVATRSAERVYPDVTGHAELIAVRLANQKLNRRDLSDCVMYSSTEPCPMCSAGTFQANIQRVVYAVSRDDLPAAFRPRKIRIAQLAEDWDYLPQVEADFLKEEALVAFEGIELPLRVVPKFHPEHVRRR